MIDLHMHSRYSDDGEFTPLELVKACASKGITHMSITDHNCGKANGEAIPAAKSCGIKYISGIEIDCVYENTNFHVLGYGINYESKDFTEIENRILEQSHQASLARLSLTQELGFHVTENDMWELSKNSYQPEVWTGEMFAEVLLAKPEYKTHPLLGLYRPGGSRSDNPYVNFYWDYYAQGKVCYIEMNYPDMREVIHTIHRNGGKAVLAHPGVNLKGKENLLEKILMLGMDGIEVYSSYHTPEQIAYYLKKVEEKGLIMTCGSDFHGKTKPAISIGNVSEDRCWTN